MALAIITEDELRAVVPLDREAMTAVEEGFAALGRGGVVMPPVLSLAIAEAHGEMDVKTAYVPGLPAFALKVSTGFFDNPKRGLPSLSGMMILISASTGQVETILLDNGYLTDLRTALAGAIAARRLAREDCAVAGIIGAGAQAAWQLEALTLVRPIRRALVWSRDPAKAAAFCVAMAAKLGFPVEPARREEVMGQADIVVTATASREPLIRAEWIRPGLHITAIGADQPGKQELAVEAVARADLLVVDHRAQATAMGELRAALNTGALADANAAVELGEICAGRRSGRASDAQVTICDLTGTGVQDTAIALHAARRVNAARAAPG